MNTASESPNLWRNCGTYATTTKNRLPYLNISAHTCLHHDAVTLTAHPLASSVTAQHYARAISPFLCLSPSHCLVRCTAHDYMRRTKMHPRCTSWDFQSTSDRNTTLKRCACPVPCISSAHPHHRACVSHPSPPSNPMLDPNIDAIQSQHYAPITGEYEHLDELQELQCTD